jgi:hypothetical protein
MRFSMKPLSWGDRLPEAELANVWSADLLFVLSSPWRKRAPYHSHKGGGRKASLGRGDLGHRGNQVGPHYFISALTYRHLSPARF